jgi:hypothetical protein
MASGDKCLPEEFMNRLRSGGKTLTPAGRPRRGPPAAKQASIPSDQPPSGRAQRAVASSGAEKQHDVPAGGNELAPAPPAWINDLYQARPRTGVADDGAGGPRNASRNPQNSATNFVSVGNLAPSTRGADKGP